MIRVTPHPWEAIFSGDLVPWQRDLLLPRRFEANIDDDRLPYIVEIEVKVFDRLPTISRLTLLQRDGGAPVTSRELRAVQLTRYLAFAVAQTACRFVTEGIAAGSVAVETMEGEEVVFKWSDVEKPRRGRRPLTDEHLQHVAELYSNAQKHGKPTREAINDKLPASTATIARWVQAAHKRGFLPPVEKSSSKEKS